MNARHLYVHVPFCARRCTYCDFAIAVRARVPVGPYLEAIAREAARTGVPTGLRTIYLGGGTPSRLGGDGIARLVTLLGAPRDLEEFTIEANPEDVTAVAARAWLAAGVTRLSLGAQSFNPRVLAWMHRTHDAPAIAAALRTARGAGFANVSLDLIFALPAHLRRDFADDLARAIALEPDHLSLYGLTVEPGTALARQLGRGEGRPAGDRQYEEEYLRAHEVLGGAGYRFYEVSNAARPGWEAVHNAAYWRLDPYLGLGPSAHSYDGAARWWNEPAYARWVRLLAEGRSPVAGRELLDERQRRLERLYLGLRTAEGIEVDEPMGNAQWATGGGALAGKAEGWVRAGWATLTPIPMPAPPSSRGPALPIAHRPLPIARRLALTPLGWLRLDELVASI